MKENKRRDKRYAAFIRPLECSGSGDRDNKVQIVDISTGGIGVTADEKILRGDMVELEIGLPDDNIPIFLAGEVIWVRKDSHTDKYQAGIKFLKLSSCDRDRIVLYIKKNFYS
jgi:c-di-GMP-binding flagellar brake protein YcgR